ncbi:hypothetical protein BH09SUM1_BH09SUM1_18240 [soil metagenome]
MNEFLWVLIPTSAALLFVVLMMGLRRGERMPAEAAREIAADDPPAEPPASTLSPHDPVEHIGYGLLQDRRFLTSTWGPDTPDLLVALWADSEHHNQLTSYRQFFLPLEQDLTAALGVLENEFFEGAEASGIPERSRLLAAFCFVFLPDRHQDLLVQSSFVFGQFDHRFFLLDADGKLSRIYPDLETTGGMLLEDHWGRYRAALADVVSGVEDAGDSMNGLVKSVECRANAYAWGAHLALRKGAGAEDAPAALKVARRFLSLAQELGPSVPIAKSESARISGEAAVRAHARTLHSLVAFHSDKQVQTGFLLAQSLVCLCQEPAAKALCELILLEAPRHPGASRLLRLITQRERGAQT